MSKHTPGPWFVNRKGEIGPKSDYDDQSYGMVIPLFEVVHAEMADAKLIAAAPEMLTALANLVDLLPDPELDNDDVQRELVLNARAAIAKAKGKE